MDRATQETFRPVIDQRLAEIVEALAADSGTEAVSPDKAIGRLSRLDSMQMQQMALAGKRRLEDERSRLKEALQRVEKGTFGSCAFCRQDIARERLEYQPDAISCVPCLDKRAR